VKGEEEIFLWGDRAGHAGRKMERDVPGVGRKKKQSSKRVHLLPGKRIAKIWM